MSKIEQKIPEGWSVKTLENCFSFSAGGDVDKDCFSFTQDEAHPYPIYANALTNQGLYGYSSKYKIAVECITITGRGDIGKVFYRKGYFTPIVRLITAIPKQGIDAKFMSFSCSRIYFYNETTGVPQLTVPQVQKYKLMVPPLPEQEKIAGILSCWDDGIEKLSALIEKKKIQKKALMQQLLTGKHRLKGFSTPWHEVKLGNIADLYQPQTISQSDLELDGYPVYGANGLIGYYHKFNHETWQIMITCRGSTCGTVNRTSGKSWITGNAMVVNVDNYKDNKLFLFFKLLNENFLSIVSGSGQPQIVRTPLAKWKLYIPTDLAEQKAIAEILSKADEEIELLNKKLEAFKQEKKALMQQLLTGKIRVKVN